MTTQHTPTPWFGDCSISGNVTIHTESREELFILQNGSCGENKENAAFIIRAVNNHEKLLRELEAAIFYIETYGGEVTSNFASGGNLATVKKIIKQAKGE